MANKRINELALRTPQTTDLMLIGDPTTGYSYKTTLLSALNLGVPTTRTLTINGTTFDLSANRTWSVGTVTSVGLTMPSAFNVASSPVTGSGTIAVTAAGLATQYIRGDGSLADFPGGGGGGGASVSYYLNGSVNQGTLGGVTYYEMNKTPILGAGTNFTTSSNGYIASFLTDANDPALLKIPGGNWNTEFYFAASSGGGTPTYYIELYKYDGSTFTLIASNSSNPDAITGGTSVEQYFTTLAVPETILTATDRLAIRIYVNTAGRTITLHTENSNLCQIITTFTTGLTALNGLTAQVQYFATGSAGTDFNISSSTATHTFNIPTASATNRGLLSTADWTTFNNKVPYTGATANVDLGIYNLSAKSVFIEGTASYQSGLAMKQLNSFDFVSGAYTQIAPSSTTELNLVYNQSGGARRRAALSAAVLQNGDNFQYLFPRQNGTFAMLTDISTAINGTTNWIPRFTSANTIGLSNLYDGSSFIGVFTATDNLSGAKLQVNGAATFSSSVTANKLISASSAFAGTLDFGTGAFKGIIDYTAGTGLWYFNNQSGAGSTTNYFQFQADSTPILTMTKGGNLGLGVQPVASTIPYFDGGSNLIISGRGNAYINNNVVFDGSFKYIVNGTASQYNISGAEHRWLTAPSGTAGNAITFTQAMTLTASGNLGIGTASPTNTAGFSRQLQIEGTYPALTLNNTGTGSGKWSLGVGSGGDFGIWNNTNSSYGLFVSSANNVGIGTATPSSTLHIVGTMKFNNTEVAGGYQTLDIIPATAIGSTVNRIVTLNTTGLAFETGLSERMRITSSGNVGIGITPSFKLHVAMPSSGAGVTFRTTGATNNPGIFFTTDEATSKGTILVSGSTGALDLSLGAGGGEIMYLKGSGRVLIGTTTDNTVDLLQVDGSVSLKTNLKMASMTTSGTAGSIVNYVQVSVNGTNYLLPLYNLP